jgi:hypothetical protein
MQAGDSNTGLLDIDTSGDYPLYFTSHAGNRFRLDLSFRLDAGYGNAVFAIDRA